MGVQIPLQSIQVPPGKHVLFQKVSWEDFEAILQELGDRRSTRVAYCNGTFEIMTPLPEHEYFKETIGDAIKDMAETLELDYESYGSTTWRQRAKQAGLESDNCFYFQNEAIVRGRLDINLAIDPPPDLALEIDVTSKSLERLPIYALLGIPELWCYDAGTLTIYQFQDGQYVEVRQSMVFPQLNIQALPQLIEANRAAGRLALRRSVRAWVREQVL
ncbi:Uma2 family endonuclease [Oculatella sp. LEGE 06141]|uniref:Uma2 family endonuclease n=1 Tax=Oculatella sp. LEGE 06141 TaxID=1828648 RepID=UPI00187E0D60|nr:Uma2 family endonuclease [Oculatella sp. LEGE 06141]MBE9180348.1 Uma2 family endonuclease [Oculatella sp. LEGE 06141]